ncbi:hypothetical protein [Flavobacterium sp.]|uniref:hypothetical protein n=1 Tax=Flavobacterium sp. TaxID=239 RepID=UPI00262F0938|nr:hypothetical protein [Flavobacterium sp.]
MKFLRFTQYVYLVAAAFMAYRTTQLWNSGTDERYLYLLFTFAALGMFFFRQWYFKKFEERAKKNQQKQP